MLVQLLLDFLSKVVAEGVKLIPPMPPEMFGLISDMQDGAGELGESVASLGMVVPFEVASGLLTVWLVLIGFWTTVGLARIVAWLVGR